MKPPSFESHPAAHCSSARTGVSAEEITQAFRDNLVCGMGKLEATATKHDLYLALALTVRDRLFQHSVTSMESYGGAESRRTSLTSPRGVFARTSSRE